MLLAALQHRSFSASTAASRSAEQSLPAAAAAATAASPSTPATISSVPVERLQRAITPEVILARSLIALGCSFRCFSWRQPLQTVCCAAMRLGCYCWGPPPACLTKSWEACCPLYR